MKVVGSRQGQIPNAEGGSVRASQHAYPRRKLGDRLREQNEHCYRNGLQNRGEACYRDQSLDKKQQPLWRAHSVQGLPQSSPDHGNEDDSEGTPSGMRSRGQEPRGTLGKHFSLFKYHRIFNSS